MKCGLLGRTLGHSYSPQIHAFLGDYPYDLFEKEPEELESFLKSGDYTGLNVTIPYKKDVIPFCDHLTPRATAMGAVNTIVRTETGELIGHNTDYYGFSSMIQHSDLDVAGKKVLVLGSGGASNTVVHVLEELGARVITVSRTGENNYNNLEQHQDAAVIVNATPVGMFPNNNSALLSLDGFSRLEGVLDLIYNPAHTKLLMDTENRGLIAENGLWMLVAQAKESAEWFTNTHLPDSIIETVHRILTQEMKNIILIGMPGCGKSTVASLLAKKLNRTCLDSDQFVEEKAQKTIPDIFAENGESEFRSLETQALACLGKQSECVISTGGGCITQMQNYPLLHQNGTIFWLKRNLEQLPTDGRPLSQSHRLADLYAQREPLYRRFSDYEIDNNGSIHDTVQNILTILGVEP